VGCARDRSTDLCFKPGIEISLGREASQSAHHHSARNSQRAGASAGNFGVQVQCRRIKKLGSRNSVNQDTRSGLR
jgi:hypothetical protein